MFLCYNNTEINFQIPEDSLWIELKINRLNENKQYERWTLYNLITKDILETKFNKSKDGYYIVTSKFKYYPGFSDRSLKIFDTKEELQNYITSLILIFNEYSYEQPHQEDNNKKNTLTRKLTKILNQK